MTDTNPPRPWLLPLLGAVCVALTIWSYLGTQDRQTWAFEQLPLGLVFVALVLIRDRFRISDFAWVSLTAFYAIQALGARYTFAEVPVPEAAMRWLGLERNPVDRIGHCMQGFVPAVLLGEWLLRRRGFRRGVAFTIVVTGWCLGFSGLYEILEMAYVLIVHPAEGVDWLGAQGDPWDAQWDMTMALGGAVAAVLGFGWLHDRSITRVDASLDPGRASGGAAREPS